MPPKTSAAGKLKNSNADVNKNGKAAKVEEVAPAGPTIKACITNAAPAPNGMSFLDALRNRKAAEAAAVAAPAPKAAPVDAAPAPKAAEKVADVVKAKPSKTPTPKPEEPVPAPVEEKKKPEPVVEAAVPTPVPAPEVVVAAPVVVEEPAPAPQAVAVPAPAPAAPVVAAQPEGHFNWAADDDLNFNFQKASPQYSVRYPAAVLDNLARNVVFKAPTRNQTIPSALENLNKERAALEQEKRAIERRESELKIKEADLANRERQIRMESDKLQAERMQAQQQLAAAQQAAVRVSPSQSPAAQQQQPPQQQPLPHAAQQQQRGFNQAYTQDWNNQQQQERWNDMPTNYDMYNYGGYAGPQGAPMRSNYQGNNYRAQQMRGGNGMAPRPQHHMQQQQQYNRPPPTGARPGMGGDMPFVPRPQQQQPYGSSYNAKQCDLH